MAMPNFNMVGKYNPNMGLEMENQICLLINSNETKLLCFTILNNF